MEKLVCYILGCEVPNKKYTFQELDPFIKNEILKKYLYSIIFFVIGIFAIFMLQSWKFSVCIILMLLWQICMSTMFYLTFSYSAFQYVDATCMGTDREFNRKIQYLQAGDFIYKITFNKKPYPKGSLIRVFIVKSNVRKNRDNTISLNSPLAICILRKDITQNLADEPQKGKTGRSIWGKIVNSIWRV